MRVNADLHIHGKFSGATSKEMNFVNLAEQAELKGLDLLGSGDILHSSWLSEFKETLFPVGNGIYQHPRYKTKFILTVEIEDINRVHHLILLPDLNSVDELRSILTKYCNSLDHDGRPRININAEDLVDIVKAVDGIVGPCHAFTPWTSIYKEFNSISHCYGEGLKNVHFIELGLSADTKMADRLKELQNKVFLTNSDAHSPWPHRIGREFNRFNLKEYSFDSIRKILRSGKGILANYGFDPRLGKYHLTACSRCKQRFRLKDALKFNMKCPKCKGLIKKGVEDRINELADWFEPKHPPDRPPYHYIPPLAEVIQIALGYSNPYVNEVQRQWRLLIETFQTEISVLIDVPIEELKKVTDERIGECIEAFRTGKFSIYPGGGGEYGKIFFNQVVDVQFYGEAQKSLMEFE
ncbi:MAG: TIGR00375 family protein [Candidatus Hydrothermarchaeota archaeon]